MRVAIYDQVEPPLPAALPVRLMQSCSQRAATTSLALVVPTAAGAVLAGASVLYDTMQAPAARAWLAQHPVLGICLLGAVGFLIYLVILPTKRVLERLTTSGTAYIDQGRVTITEVGPFRTRTWSAPLAGYRGIAHHVRASLAGVRHELILVHPERSKCVLLSVAPRTSQSEVDHAAALLGQPVIPPSELYRFNGLRPRLAAPPISDAAHA